MPAPAHFRLRCAAGARTRARDLEFSARRGGRAPRRGLPRSHGPGERRARAHPHGRSLDARRAGTCAPSPRAARTPTAVRCELARERLRDAGAWRPGELSARRGVAAAGRSHAAEGHSRAAARSLAHRRMVRYAAHARAPLGERSLAVRRACQVPRHGLCPRGPRTRPSRRQRLASQATRRRDT